MLIRIKNFALKRLNIAKISFVEVLSYRIDIISIFISTIFVLGLSYYLWNAIYGSDLVTNTYSFKEMITYIVLAVLMNSVFNTPRRMPVNISREIKSGHIAHKLIKPISYFELNLWHCFGRGLYFFLVVTIPLGIVAFFTLDLLFPADRINFIAFIISFVLSFFIEVGISLVLSGFIFVIVQMEGILRVNALLSYLFSGRLIPLVFFPKWLSRIAYLLPYHNTVSVPIQIYLGKGNVINMIGMQIIWIVILFIVSSILFNNAFEKLEVVGG